MIAVFHNTDTLEKARIAHAVTQGLRQPDGEPWPNRLTKYVNGYKKSHEREAWGYEFEDQEEIKALSDEVHEDWPEEFIEPEQPI